MHLNWAREWWTGRSSLLGWASKGRESGIRGVWRDQPTLVAPVGSFVLSAPAYIRLVLRPGEQVLVAESRDRRRARHGRCVVREAVLALPTHV